MMNPKSGTSAPPLDLDGFRSAMRAAAIEEMVEPILVIFLQESGKHVDSIETGLASGNEETCRRAAHTLKGSAGNVHARSLAKVAESIELAVQRGDVAAAIDLLRALRAEHAATIRFLAENGVAA